MRPFRFELPDGAVADLRRRLAATRWPDAEPVDDRSQGVPLADVRELCRYWAEDYDWPAAVARINALPQFVVDIDGLDVHAAHVRSPHDGALPLLMTHGWPGSFLEFTDVAHRLADPVAWGGDAADAFHVVCPSLPGFAFSGRPTQPGWGPARTAAAWRRLMTALGYERFGVQGGDWGARVSQIVGATDQRVVGTHLNFVLVEPDPATIGDLTADERRALDDVAHMDRWGRGYFMQQMTRPQTVGYGLNDSPAGLCAWIAEKVLDWADPASPRPTRDQLLDNVGLYWLTGNGDVVGADVLGVRRRGAEPGPDRPGRLHDLPPRAAPAVAPLGGERVPRAVLLERGGRRRALRGVGAAGAVRRRGARLLPPRQVIPATGVATAAATRPAMRPNVMAVPIACPCETYWLPKTLPVTSPAASRPGIGRPVSSSTWASGSMRTPYPVTGTIIGLIATA